MKHIKLTTFILSLLLIGCNQADKKTTSSPNQPSTDKPSGIVTNDKENLQQLVRNLYKWHENKSTQNDFDPTADNQDSIYVGLDLNKHEQRLAELKKTNFFSDQFLDNYNKIALTIDEGLKSKKLEWFVGEIPPFGNDTNPWCDCQDNPERYWESMTIDKITIDNKTATFIWTWGNNFKYKVKAIKENDNWKITYLQGFDFNDFVPTK
jgi:hypothetical protein